MNQPQTWIRFEAHGRYHLVFGEVWNTTFVTYCGRTQQKSAVKAATDNPPARCNCCRSRFKHPYLIPDKLQQFKVVA